jgi:hypothetical protein
MQDQLNWQIGKLLALNGNCLKSLTLEFPSFLFLFIDSAFSSVAFTKSELSMSENVFVAWRFGAIMETWKTRLCPWVFTCQLSQFFHT